MVARLIRSSYMTEVTKDKVSLIYEIVKGKTMDVGKLFKIQSSKLLQGQTMLVFHFPTSPMNCVKILELLGKYKKKYRWPDLLSLYSITCDLWEMLRMRSEEKMINIIRRERDEYNQHVQELRGPPPSPNERMNTGSDSLYWREVLGSKDRSWRSTSTSQTRSCPMS